MHVPLPTTHHLHPDREGQPEFPAGKVPGRRQRLTVAEGGGSQPLVRVHEGAIRPVVTPRPLREGVDTEDTRVWCEGSQRRSAGAAQTKPHTRKDVVLPEQDSTLRRRSRAPADDTLRTLIAAPTTRASRRAP